MPVGDACAMYQVVQVIFLASSEEQATEPGYPCSLLAEFPNPLLDVECI